MTRKPGEQQKQDPKAKQPPVPPSAPASGLRKEPPASAAGEASPRFPIVGIGASAGGLGAIEAFLSGLPADGEPGMAFILVQHLAPDHASMLTELVSHYTRMRVFQVEDGMVVRPNCAYIIPPGKDMAFLNGALQLLDPVAIRGQRLPIDYFFRSLAQDLHERAIGVILSGTGSDGTLGIRAIKGEGGMVMVQNPESTEFDGMPRSALATGLVDFELPPAEMPGQLLAYVAHAFGKLPRIDPATALRTEGTMKKIFVLLRAQSGHDFSQYKPSTIHRRIERRMAVHQIDRLDNYLQFLQHDRGELETLFQDLLIGVTSFFRDKEAFQLLEEQVIPGLFEGKAPGEAVRVWATGCSTGEEAYSIAILLQERLETLKQHHVMQVFATDIDSRAIATARVGLYPASIAADLTPERLARFFTAEPGGGFRIHKGIRDLLIFSEQDVIKDPPFSRMDLISCRNLLIYMGDALQKKLIPLFHYALNPGGFLFLGTSETVGDFGDLFTAVDRKLKVYRRRDGNSGAERVAFSRFHPPGLPKAEAALVKPRVKAAPPRRSPRELTEQGLLQHFATVGALVNGQGDLLYLHGRSSPFLEPVPGEPGVPNLLKMAREGLHRDLAQALRKAAGSCETVRRPGLRVETHGHAATLNLSIVPVPEASASTLDPPLYLVVLEAQPETSPASGGSAAAHGGTVEGDAVAEAEARVAALLQELQAKEEYLHSANEELETSNEELKSSNEEMQSVNEEIQSANEELETSKEELQSVNEELATVNTELQTKVADLSRVNNDMNNLLAGTGIATVFVDRALRILRFTPATTRIINLILSDVGRPVGHIVSNLVGYDRLVEDIESVLDTLIPMEVVVQNREGAWYTLRIQPYRTLDNVIEGAVIAFLDITEIVRTREALRKANDLQRLAVVVRDAHDAITVQDLQGRTLAWNPGAERQYGWTEAEALEMNVRDRIPQGLREEALAKLRQLSHAEVLEPYLTQRLNKGGALVEVSIISTALMDEAGRCYAVATTERARETKRGPAAEVPDAQPN